jgi:hypothetical protein
LLFIDFNENMPFFMLNRVEKSSIFGQVDVNYVS